MKDKYEYVITWDIDSKDYLPISSAEVLTKVATNTKNGSIVDLHDGNEIDSDLKERKTIDVLPRIIPELRNRDFNLFRIDEMELGSR